MNFMKETCVTKKVKVFAVIIVFYIFILLLPNQILADKTLQCNALLADPKS